MEVAVLAFLLRLVSAASQLRVHHSKLAIGRGGLLVGLKLSASLTPSELHAHGKARVA